MERARQQDHEYRVQPPPSADGASDPLQDDNLTDLLEVERLQEVVKAAAKDFSDKRRALKLAKRALAENASTSSLNVSEEAKREATPTTSDQAGDETGNNTMQLAKDQVMAETTPSTPTMSKRQKLRQQQRDRKAEILRRSELKAHKKMRQMELKAHNKADALRRKESKEQNPEAEKPKRKRKPKSERRAEHQRIQAGRQANLAGAIFGLKGAVSALTKGQRLDLINLREKGRILPGDIIPTYFEARQTTASASLEEDSDSEDESMEDVLSDADDGGVSVHAADVAPAVLQDMSGLTIEGKANTSFH